MDSKIIIVNCLVGLAFVIQVSLCADKESLTVKTNAGTFTGHFRKFKAFGHDLAVWRFLGIPYAEPPVGDLRFQKPKRKAKLENTYDAVEHGPTCMQQMINLGGKRKLGRIESLNYSEDCLFLNIFTPHTAEQSDEMFPVMIYIHGGAYVFGSPELYPHDIMSAYGKVVAVTIAYRLSIWGFLSTGDQELPGNYGLWDQQLAIRWVHENIAKFGGDPNSVTIYGSSAGGSSVVYQGLYPGNQGLIHRLISQSGTSTSAFALNKDPLSTAKLIGSLVGCDDFRSTKHLAECLKSKSTEELSEALTLHNRKFPTYSHQFVPVIDADFILERPTHIFHGLSDLSLRYLNAFANLDLMTGVTSGEGLITFAPMYDVKSSDHFQVSRGKFENEMVPKVVSTLFGKDANNVLNTLIIGEYTNWSDPDNKVQSRESYIKLNGDYKFGVKAIETARAHAGVSAKNTFVYLYDALISQHHFPSPEWARQPTHLDEMTTILGFDNEDGYTSWTTPYTDSPPSDTELELSKAHIKMWANFARTGNPNGPVDIQTATNTVWPEYNTQSEKYLRIALPVSASSVGQRLLARETNFWNKVLPEMAEALKNERGKSIDEKNEYCERDGSCGP